MRSVNWWSARRIISSGAELPHIPAIFPATPASGGVLGPTRPLRWEFTDVGHDFEVAVDPRVTTNDMAVMIRLALAATGLTFGLQDSFRPHLDRGDFVAVLEGYCAPFPGFQLFYPRSRQAPPKLRLLVEHIRRWRRSSCSALQVDHRTP